MSLRLDDCLFFGAALPEPFVKFELEGHLQNEKLLPKNSGIEGKELSDAWDTIRRKLSSLGQQGGSRHVANHILKPLLPSLGYAEMVPAGEVQTREGPEDGGLLLKTASGQASAQPAHPAHLRAWTLETGADFDAPNQRGRAYRFSPTQVAERVLLKEGERLGLLSDGTELRLLFCDPARTSGYMSIRLDKTGGWRGSRTMPDSFRLLLALASPRGLTLLPELLEQARLTQARVTAKLREQAKRAVMGFVQTVLDEPGNALVLGEFGDRQGLAEKLWSEALVLIYRLLFVLKLESSPDQARAFSFRSTSLWRNSYSPNTALAPLVRKVLDEGAQTGGMLGEGLRVLFRLFQEGLRSSEMNVSALGGMLFGAGTTPLLDRLAWPELSVAKLLDALFWTPSGGKSEVRRVHYGSLEVEDLGRVYEALLELSPGIAEQPLCRLRRQKLEVCVPLAQGEAYRGNLREGDGRNEGKEESGAEGEGAGAGEEEEEEEEGKGKTRVEWIEEIRAGAFYLRTGLGRKSTGSYYTPHAFVRFLIEETLGPQIEQKSPLEDPQPMEILGLRVLDPAMGSGHFLVEACRYLGMKLYEACRRCDEMASEEDKLAEKAGSEAERAGHAARAMELRRRVEILPDPQDELVAYLPSRASEGEESGFSQSKAEALCRRLAAVHCLYGVDKNPLAVELAKLALWLESYAEGLPLTFLDHRLLCGDSLTGPFFEQLGTFPKRGEELRGDLFAHKLHQRLKANLGEALLHVRDLEASIGKDVEDVERKRAAKAKLDKALLPFKTLGEAWSGGVMLGELGDDEGYRLLMEAVAEGRELGELIEGRPSLGRMLKAGRGALSYDLIFPEVFYAGGELEKRGGFAAVVGNPPWDALQPLAKEFYASYDLRIIDAPTRLERAATEKRLSADAGVKEAYGSYLSGIEGMKALVERSFGYVNRQAGGAKSGAVTDIWQCFAERGARLLGEKGRFGMVLPSAFHANQSATGIRELLLRHLQLKSCFSFENRKKLFEIDSRFKFALVVALKGEGATEAFECAFYLHDLEWLFKGRQSLRYTRSFVEKTGGAYFTLLELRAPMDAEVAEKCFRGSEALGSIRGKMHLRLGVEIDMSKGAHLFTPIASISPADPRDPSVAQALRAQGYLPLHEGKTFHQYTDRWENRPRYMVSLAKLGDKPGWLQAARYFRLAFRDIARSTDERTGIFCMLPPGVVLGNTGPCEREPWARRYSDALSFLACMNSFPLDWTLRQKSAAHVNLFILDACPLPPTAFQDPYPYKKFLAHAALRLSCNHQGFDALWKEQLGDAWREDTSAHTYPILPDNKNPARAALRAAADALVAQAYGLSREHYAHILNSFNHKSHPQAPELCLQAFDRLQSMGLDAFVKENDAYWDIPLPEHLPKPALDFQAISLSEPSLGPEPEPVAQPMPQPGATLSLMDIGPSQGKAKGRKKKS